MNNGRYQCFPFMVYTYDSVDSTNSVAKRAIAMMGESMDMSVHVAGEQTAGRGRSGRTWLNTEDAVMMSIVVRTKLGMEKMPILNLAAALAVRNAVEKLTKGKICLSVKWPNDLVTAERLEKVCGILSEAVSFDRKKYAVIGIGLNLNAKDVPEGLLQPATSIYREYGGYIRVLEAVDCIIEEFDKQYKLVLNDTESFLKDFAKDCISIGRRLKVDYGDRVRYGAGDRLAPNGQLIVRFEDGETDVVYSADVSVRNLAIIDEKLARSLLPKRPPVSNKGTFGRALMIVGSEGMPGAALMSVKACLRGGAGLTKALVPESALGLFSAAPEAMLSTRDEDVDQLIKWAKAIGVGCGMGVNARTRALVEKTLRSGKPCVIDADALNTVAKYPELKELLHEKAVLTPHPAEMARLVGSSAEAIAKGMTSAALDFAVRYGCIVHLKSHFSVTASPEGTLRYNETGTSGLAKGGSGDVLTGLITSFTAQGAKPFDAASLGAYMLGISAEKAIDFLHNRFVCAGDMIDIITSEINERGNI